MYDSARYFVMTGAVLRDIAIRERSEQLAELHARLFGPAGQSDDRPRLQRLCSVDDEELLRRIRASKQAEKFEKLWSGDRALHAGDDSAADLALCSILAFWTQRDRHRIDRLFRSGLCRQKWEREDYRDCTLERACQIKAVYNPETLILDLADPLNSAREFVARCQAMDGIRTLQHQDGAFYRYDPSASVYCRLDEGSLRAALYEFLEGAKVWEKSRQDWVLIRRGRVAAAEHHSLRTAKDTTPRPKRRSRIQIGEPRLFVIVFFEIVNRVLGVFERFVQFFQFVVAVGIGSVREFVHGRLGIVDVGGEFVEFP
jgi:hypothetical protein